MTQPRSSRPQPHKRRPERSEEARGPGEASGESANGHADEFEPLEKAPQNREDSRSTSRSTESERTRGRRRGARDGEGDSKRGSQRKKTRNSPQKPIAHLDRALRDLPEEEQPEVVSCEDIDYADLDHDALRVLSKLRRSGHEAYLVGGCVRDLKLGRTPKDFDLATAAHPRQIKRLFHNGRIIGRRFKLVHVFYGGNIIETATFRQAPSRAAGSDTDDESNPEPSGEDLLIVDDNEYGTAAEDARRRDFTINGLFLDPDTRPRPSKRRQAPRIIDFVGGLKDLELGILRTIGNPFVRMAEDPVRILRAIKFATRLGFRIEERTWDAMCDMAPELARSARPRVLEELLRLFRSGTSLGAFRSLWACGALRVLLPSIDEYLGPYTPKPVKGAKRNRREDASPEELERARTFWSLLEALDATVHDGYVPSSAVCIAVLFFRLFERESEPETRTLPGEPTDAFSVMTEVVEPFAQESRLPKKDFARARRIIVNQRRFTQPQGRQFRPLLFMLGEDFEESLELFRLRSMAWGQGWDVYEGWVERYKRALEASDDEIEDVRRQTRRRRRRRRRTGEGRGPRKSAPND